MREGYDHRRASGLASQTVRSHGKAEDGISDKVKH